MKVYKIPLTLAEHVSDIKIKLVALKNPSFICNQVICAYNGLRYQVRVCRTIGPLVLIVTIAGKSYGRLCNYYSDD